MKTYEIEVEMTVRRTMRVRAPGTDTAAMVARAMIELTMAGRGELSSVLKWTDGRVAYRPMPVETILPEPTPVLLGEPVEVIGEPEGSAERRGARYR